VLLDRGRKAGRYLEWKVRIFSVAAVLALVGIYMESGWMTGAAIGMLVVGMLLRFLPADAEGPEDGDGE